MSRQPHFLAPAALLACLIAASLSAQQTPSTAGGWHVAKNQPKKDEVFRAHVLVGMAHDSATRVSPQDSVRTVTLSNSGMGALWFATPAASCAGDETDTTSDVGLRDTVLTACARIDAAGPVKLLALVHDPAARIAAARVLASDSFTASTFWRSPPGWFLSIFTTVLAFGSGFLSHRLQGSWDRRARRKETAQEEKRKATQHRREMEKLITETLVAERMANIRRLDEWLEKKNGQVVTPETLIVTHWEALQKPQRGALAYLAAKDREAFTATSRTLYETIREYNRAVEAFKSLPPGPEEKLRRAAELLHRAAELMKEAFDVDAARAGEVQKELGRIQKELEELQREPVRTVQ